MINALNVKTTLLTLAACLVCAASAAQAAMYKWTDESGTATFSDQPPAEPDKVSNLTVVDTQPKPQQPSYTHAPAKFGESFRPDPPRAAENSASTKAESDPVVRELARLQARGRTEAVRDPCLISADPRCYERNKDRYHPYFGYAPSVTQPASTSATGATNATAGGGTVGGQPLRDTPISHGTSTLLRR
jgi:hypothetical protein